MQPLQSLLSHTVRAADILHNCPSRVANSNALSQQPCNLCVCVCVYCMQVTLVNRLLRVFTVFMVALSMTPHKTSHFLSIIEHKRPSQSSPWISLMRLLLGVPVFYITHANFVLPFPYVLAAQLCTLFSTCMMTRTVACAVMQQADAIQRAHQLCKRLKTVMHFSSFTPGVPPWEVASAAARECQGVDAVMLLSLYGNVLVLVVLPCLVVYFMELNLKVGFVRQRQLAMHHAWPCLESRLCKCVIVYASVVGSWMACEGLVLLLSPMQCSSAGLLEYAGP